MLLKITRNICAEKKRTIFLTFSRRWQLPRSAVVIHSIAFKKAKCVGTFVLIVLIESGERKKAKQHHKMPKQTPEKVKRSAITAAASPYETGRRIRVCRKCSGCLRTPCRLCIYCRGMAPSANTRSCMFRLCLHLSYSERMQRNVALAARRSFESLSTSYATLTNIQQQNDHNNRSDAQRFLNQCKSILVRIHCFSINWQNWQQNSSSWRVWHYQSQQWGTAYRVSSHPPRYEIQLLVSSSRKHKNNTSNNCSTPPSPPPRSRSKHTRKNNNRPDNVTVLTNVRPYVSSTPNEIVRGHRTVT